jgi:tetraacyldisaccharide 4'-kinase
MGHFLHHHLPRIWASRQAIAWLLTPLSILYGIALLLRRQSYQWGLKKRHRLHVPVVVVGNVVAGGAGKTPVTLAIVAHLQAQGWHPGVISRGHGRRTHDTRQVDNDSHPADVGDEPLLIRQKTHVPVWVARLRADAGMALLQAHPETDILVCDDGLQHWALARDVDICVMDDRGIGNGWLLPAGPLREPWPKPVDFLLHTGANQIPGGFQAHRQLADWAVDAQGRRVALNSLLDQPVDALAGLARPEGFFRLLRDKGLNLHETLALPDHFDFEAWTRRALTRPLLCTEKDAVKLWRHQAQALSVPLVLQIEPDFWSALDQRLLSLKPR